MDAETLNKANALARELSDINQRVEAFRLIRTRNETVGSSFKKSARIVVTDGGYSIAALELAAQPDIFKTFFMLLETVVKERQAELEKKFKELGRETS